MAMQCTKCGSQNVQVTTNTHGKIKRRGLFMSIVHITLIICTAGLWLIVPLLRGGSKGKIKTEQVWMCAGCGARVA
jgi:hypothetical protein